MSDYIPPSISNKSPFNIGDKVKIKGYKRIYTIIETLSDIDVIVNKADVNNKFSVKDCVLISSNK